MTMTPRPRNSVRFFISAPHRTGRRDRPYYIIPDAISISTNFVKQITMFAAAAFISRRDGSVGRKRRSPYNDRVLWCEECVNGLLRQGSRPGPDSGCRRTVARLQLGSCHSGSKEDGIGSIQPVDGVPSHHAAYGNNVCGDCVFLV